MRREVHDALELILKAGQLHGVTVGWKQSGSPCSFAGIDRLHLDAQFFSVFSLKNAIGGVRVHSCHNANGLGEVHTENNWNLNAGAGS
jgi:hypothetical protein